MRYILSAVTILDPTSDFHNQTVDVLIDQGVIIEIAESIVDEKARKIDLPVGEKFLSIGLFDLSVHFHDPGHEYKEGLENGLDLLKKSGFTGAGLIPNTKPVIQRKTDISYVKGKSQQSLVDLFPYGAITVDCQGKELTEMIDMHYAGAIAFTDGLNPIENADILMKTLLYLQKFDGVLIQKPEDVRLNLFGSMHEGKTSTMLGLKGMPDIAESLVVQRDLKLLAYTNGKIHFSGISTAESVTLIKEAKDKGLAVTCDVAMHQLLLDEKDVGDYDTNCKVNPPLRTEADRLALLGGVESGVIDVITSHHLPQDEENKKMEFDLAAFGAIGIQTFLSNLIKLSSEISIDRLLSCCTINPRQVLSIPTGSIRKGDQVNFTIFTKDQSIDYTLESNWSNSANSPFIGQQLKGSVIGVANGVELYIKG